MNKRLSLLATLCGLLSACAQTAPSAAGKVGLANPASTFCLEQEGSLSIKKTPKGDIGLCTLPSGQTVEEWAYFRQHHRH